jgi:hypothetical protein
MADSLIEQLWSDDWTTVRDASIRADAPDAPNWMKIQGVLAARDSRSAERAAAAAVETARATRLLAYATFVLAIVTVVLVTVIAAVSGGGD